jgi:hypothetical protein
MAADYTRHTESLLLVKKKRDHLLTRCDKYLQSATLHSTHKNKNKIE